MFFVQPQMPRKNKTLQTAAQIKRIYCDKGVIYKTMYLSLLSKKITRLNRGTLTKNKQTPQRAVFSF